MNPHNTTRNGSRLSIYPQSANLLRPLTAAKLNPNETSSFASALAHEVRNPLSNINLAVEMLRSSTREEDQKTYLDVIARSSVRINDLVSDFLASQDADEIQSEKYPIHKLLDEVLAMNKDRIMLKNILISTDYSALDCKILINKQKIRIALTNIIINAIDSMDSNSGKLRLVTRSINDECILEIEDNGSGISEKNMKNIFKPYYTNKPGGMGLGLSTTLDILLSNQARVEVQSEEGRGTRFIISFETTQQALACSYTIPVSILA